MKALVIDQPGDHRALYLAEVPLPEPGSLEVRVRIKAIGLNPADNKAMARGLPEWTYPFIPGLDAAGVIDSVGADVVQWKPGDRVAFHGNLRKAGVFAEYTITTVYALARIPEHVPFTHAASIPCSGLAAMHALEKLNLAAGEALLILGGAGGVGSLAIQLAKSSGLVVVATASSRHQNYLRELGADYCIDYLSQDIGVEIDQITQGNKLSAVFDTVGFQANRDLFSWLGYNGQFVTIVDVPPLPKDFFNRSLSFHAILFGALYRFGTAEQQQALSGRALTTLLNHVGAGRLKPQISRQIDWLEIPDGLYQLGSGHVSGKIVAVL